MNWLKKYTRGLLHLFFPNTCLLCSKPLFLEEKTVCYRCVSELEPSRIVDFSDNEITQLFEGKVPIVSAFTGFRYHKLGKLQQLIFQLKYHHHKEIGMILGREMGHALENTPFASVDYIIPVPLHPKKQRCTFASEKATQARLQSGRMDCERFGRSFAEKSANRCSAA
ncbi:MAG: hypothetical protein CSA94_02700 [Bacteroidetes bacterium]|nr:MAG: hypothetical protein CSA94_02700 [Bacteroidota bacterium]